ncbi:YceI family protein [Corynebacterium pseudotuberculosis]|uniref:Polyisoprenoid-binding protein n=1 Tax=Corynebacterium pseudotuberculosis (strain C231) TaxID=681645 RepID=D9Q9S7_CORP2|nr:YceI family protein [Corynebacterium pseudotuberculosis]ADK28615.1 polyisoprenoid-binding protein [Corynebacterium pseudotuberculosis FRC41]ADL10303.1 polyisoprenoid-binding protein [Corynebacterium pseudotuberculosis C231]ADL20708.1 polyisoprenoid-binding protein [Corynebacterium pseudotuberculosis 1002]ADO26095.1 polyisoprenoid-binding protein [Corynebacterium pseudotuberculosis I19]AEK92151.1 Metabolite transport protein yceI [Corynebacterium pseudotuberculosis PAT10]
MSNFDGTYVLDPAHTTIGFVARHAMVTKVRGHFTEFSSSVTVEGSTATVNATIQTESITTGNNDHDDHVKGTDFFNTVEFPEMTFTSTSVSISGDKATVTGDLTIKGVTKQVDLDVSIDGIAEDPFGNTRLGFEARTKINRTDFGIDFNAPLKTGGVLLSEEIKIEIEGSAIKQA